MSRQRGILLIEENDQKTDGNYSWLMIHWNGISWNRDQ